MRAQVVPGPEMVEHMLPMLVAACDRSEPDASLELQVCVLQVSPQGLACAAI